ncbi:MAG: endolytic transglycosylase MltG [Paludibacteraceae bacterium]|nr:endolytic transglycosylase MltG [Paludibacteraceae bacterium]
MKKGMKKAVLALQVLALLIAVTLCVGAWGYYRGYVCNWASTDNQSHGYYIYPDMPVDSVLHMVQADYRISSPLWLHWHIRCAGWNKPCAGYYEFPERMGDKTLINRMMHGRQTPVNLRFTNQIRNREQLAARIGKVLLVDSLEIKERLDSVIYMAQYGLTLETAICLFIPNTYEVYWSLSADDLFARMEKEYKRFWTEERLRLAKQQGLTPAEVATLASIVESETNRTSEHPQIASLYLNRLRKGMALQACPTVIFANGDFMVRRVSGAMLQSNSPYNTYRYVGLPPGPIRCANGATMDAVLHAPQTDYLYMCANPDWSGTHVFSSTYAQHQRVAAAYRRELNKRNIR